MDTYKIALWSLNLGIAPSGLPGFVERIETAMARAANGGAKLLVMPEYAIETCLAFKPDGLAPHDEMAFLGGIGAELVSGLRDLPEKHGVSLLAGTMPVAANGGYTNTAVLLTADGREIRQDKLCLTPFEKDAETWLLTPGSSFKVIELDGLRIGILICLDIEMPALSSLIAPLELDLLLVPSMTERQSGFRRVFDCAKARAVELMSAVAVCGVVGSAKGTTQNERTYSGAALYLPCEEALGSTGIGAAASETDGMHGEEPFLFADVPVSTLRSLRKGAAEVWPGGWRADHVVVMT